MCCFIFLQEPYKRGLQALKADEIRHIELTYRVALARYVPTIQQLDSAFERTLDVLEALWVAHALKEKEFEPWYSELRSMHAQEV